MSRQVSGPLAAVALGTAAAGAGVWFVGDYLLAGAAGLCVAVCAGLSVVTARKYPERVTGGGWTDGRWTGLSVWAVCAAGLLGFVTVEPSAEALAGAQVLVILAGLVGYLGGSLSEMERDRARADRSDGTAAADD